MKEFMGETGLSRMDATYFISHKLAMDLGQEIIDGRSVQDATEFMFGTLYNMASDFEVTNVERRPIFEFMMDVVLDNIRTIKSRQSQVSWLRRKMGVDRLIKSSILVLVGVTNKVKTQSDNITSAF
jgi:glutathione peroxidase-family protein